MARSRSMYTVARFFGSKVSQDELVELGREMNALQDGVFTGLHRSGFGFNCDVCRDSTWYEHEREIRDFVSRFSRPIAWATGHAMSVMFDIAIDHEDLAAAVAYVGLALSPDLMLALAAAGITLAISAYVGPERPAEEAAPDERAPDLRPSQADLAPIGALAPAELEEIDSALLANAKPRQQKVAMVVAMAMRELDKRFPGIPDVFYAQRVRRLVRLGQLEGYGNLGRMRFSEVRLSDRGKLAAPPGVDKRRDDDRDG